MPGRLQYIDLDPRQLRIDTALTPPPMFVDLYGSNGNVRLRPKHHLLAHLPSIILKSGPLVGMCCIRYELKNSFFKRSAHIVCNFTNICKTLAYRHQQCALYSLLSADYLRNIMVVTAHRTVPVCTLPFSELLCDRFSVENTDDVSVASKVSIASLQYRKGHVVCIGEDDETGLPQFGKIDCFVSCSNNNHWYLVVESVITVNFCAHVHASVNQ